MTRTKNAKAKLFYRVAASLGLFMAAQQTLALTSPEQITRLVTGAVKERLEKQRITDTGSQRVEVSVVGIDPRLQLSDCPQSPVVELRATDLIGKVNVKVSCEGSSPWSIYVPTQVRVFKKVVAVKTPLARGEIIESADIYLIEKDVGSLNGGYFGSPQAVIGKELKRHASLNTALSPAYISEPQVIERGDEVVIKASAGSIEVRSSGIAMTDGRIGQLISVKNAKSKRIIKAEVIEKGLVAVAL